MFSLIVDPLLILTFYSSVAVVDEHVAVHFHLYNDVNATGAVIGRCP